MKERPILFKTDMVRAILDGRKTQTRRVVSPKALEKSTLEYADCTEGLRCPYGKPGELLWVRETFADIGRPDRLPEYVYKADFKPEEWEESEKERKALGYKWTPSIFMPRGASRITLEIKDVRVERLQEITHTDAVAEGCCKVKDKTWGRLGFSQLWDSINAKPRPMRVGGVIHHYESFPWKDGSFVAEYRGKPWYVYGNPWVWVITFNRKAPR